VTEHEELSELLPLHALGSLESGDEARLKEHLAACAPCRRELSSLRGLVGELAAALPPSPPPPGLEGSIMAALPPLPARSRLRTRRRSLPLLATAAIALIAVLGAGNIIQWQQSRAAEPPRNPNALLTLTLAGRGSGAFGTVVLDPEDNEGVLAVRGLSALDPSRSYQLWLVKGALQGSGGLFAVDAHGYGSLLLDVPPELRGFESFLVTSEPRGGSPAPTTDAVMEGHR
jgi:anti-sigma-K factor RskA